MQGLFKPLLPLRSVWPHPKELSALESIIQTHAHNGIEHIFVVTGQRESAALTQHVTEIQARLRGKQKLYLVSNPQAERGMFSSVCEGLHAIQHSNILKQCSHCFIQPVDIALVRACTLQFLMQASRTQPHSVLIPTYKGRTGHPPLIPLAFIEQILNHNGDKGLQGALEHLPQATIATADSHMLLDMDTVQDYTLLQKKALQHHLLTPAEAVELLHCLNLPPLGLAHAQGVANVATAFAKAYTRRALPNTHIHIGLTKTGALLHDMCKQEKQHEQAAGKALRQLGLGALAPLVEEHNDCQLAADAPVSEKELIYLADKYVRGKWFIPLAQRFEQKLEMYAHVPEACIAIRARLGRAKAMEQRVAQELGITPATLAQQVLPTTC